MKISEEEASKAAIGPRALKPKGSRERAIQTLSLIRTLWQIKSSDEKKWKEVLSEAEEERIYKVLGYSDLDTCLNAELGITIAKIDALRKPGPPKGSKNAQKRRLTIDQNNVANGHIKRTNQQSSNSHIRLVGRLKRDHKDIFAALERGDYPSVRQAAIAAGIVKEKTALEKAQWHYLKLTDDERNEFQIWLREQ